MQNLWPHTDGKLYVSKIPEYLNEVWEDLGMEADGKGRPPSLWTDTAAVYTIKNYARKTSVGYFRHG